VPYYHVVFTLSEPISDIAYQNKAVIYDVLFKAAAETLITIAADPRHLGARIGLTAPRTSPASVSCSASWQGRTSPATLTPMPMSRRCARSHARAAVAA
jgi:hypothetical protein